MFYMVFAVVKNDVVGVVVYVIVIVDVLCCFCCNVKCFFLLKMDRP
jgi:hypothetical protein